MPYSVSIKSIALRLTASPGRASVLLPLSPSLAADPLRAQARARCCKAQRLSASVEEVEESLSLFCSPAEPFLSPERELYIPP